MCACVCVGACVWVWVSGCGWEDGSNMHECAAMVYSATTKKICTAEHDQGLTK